MQTLGETVARSLWIEAAGKAAIRAEPLRAPAPGQAEVRTLFSGISRGTEALVLAGRVPPAEFQRMACPHQGGAFPFPVKYGYAAVGLVEEGPPSLYGQTVFLLHPHQDRLVAPADVLVAVPASVPAARAVLAANMETALNIVWDAGVGPGDKVCVVGAGVVGALTAWLAGEIPGVEATLVDVQPGRAALAAALGVGFSAPEQAPADCDVVVHASATAAGLTAALAAAGVEATVAEASWYGDRPVSIGLGGAFHSRRLKLVGSQVGSVPPARRPRWSHARRLAKALELLADPRLDALISGESDFAGIADVYPGILASPGTLCHRIRY